jgi:hypothetical protein
MIKGRKGERSRTLDMSTLASGKRMSGPEISGQNTPGGGEKAYEWVFPHHGQNLYTGEPSSHLPGLPRQVCQPGQEARLPFLRLAETLFTEVKGRKEKVEGGYRESPESVGVEGSL